MKLYILLFFLLQVGYAQIEVIEETSNYKSNLKILEANLTTVSNNELNDVLTSVINKEQNCFNNHWVVYLGFQKEKEYIYIYIYRNCTEH